jgi:hypothetical protein
VSGGAALVIFDIATVFGVFVGITVPVLLLLRHVR